MKIEIKGYKNIDSLSYEITEYKANVLIGVSGSGKSSIASALLEDDFDFNKKVGYIGAVSANLNGIKVLDEEMSVFSESTLNNYLFEETKNESIFNVLIDDDNIYTKSRKKLDTVLDEISKQIKISDKNEQEYLSLQNQLGGNLTSTNKLRSTSAVKKMKKSIASLTRKRFYRKISILDKDLVKWRVSGEKFLTNHKCPYCEKIISSTKEKELHDYKHIDINSYGKVDLSSTQLDLINSPKVILTDKGLQKLENELISIGVALKEYHKLKSDIEVLFDTDFDINKISKFIYEDELFVHFPSLKGPVNKLKRNITRLSGAAREAQNKTKSVLLRKLKNINKTLKSFGIPYKIEAKYRQSKIEGYKLYHCDDVSKEDRSRGLSTGEKKIVSLIFFILEQKKFTKKLIIFDDPVSSYDENRRFSIFKYMLNNLQGKTYLILSHDQSFAKYASFSTKHCIGKVDYFSNDGNSIKTIPISKSDFSNITDYIINRINNSSNYMQLIINLRYYYEINRKYPEYSYLSAIIHKDNVSTWLSKSKFNENQILNKINKRFNIVLSKFNLSVYTGINTTGYTDIEKIFLLREVVTEKTLKNEISNYVHLNTAYAVSLNPYKFSFCSNYLLDEVKAKISNLYDM